MSTTAGALDCIELVYINNINPKPGQFREQGWRFTEEAQEAMRLQRWLDRMAFIVLKTMLRRRKR